MSALDAEKPWNTVIRESTDNLEYWLQELQEPAMIYSSLRADTAPSYALQQHEQTQNKGGGKRGSNNGGKGGHPRCNRGVHSTNHDGRELCYKLNKDGCAPGCHRAHQCQHCLGPHKVLDCPRANARAKRKASAKGKRKDSESGAGWPSS